MKKVLFVLFVIFIMISTYAVVEQFTATVTIGPKVTPAQEGQSVVYYLKMFNSRIFGEVSTNSNSSDPILVPVVNPTQIAPLSPSEVVVPIDKVSTIGNVSVSLSSDNKYYNVLFKKGFKMGEDGFCLNLSDVPIPLRSTTHGKYCFTISDWHIFDSKIMNVQILAKRIPSDSTDLRTVVDCDWRGGSVTAMIQPGDGGNFWSEGFWCSIQRDDWSGSDEIPDVLQIIFADSGAVQYDNEDVGFNVKLKFVSGPGKYLSLPQ